MKKFSLIAILLTGLLFLENCKKDTVVATATSTSLMIANIKDSTWYTDTVKSSLTYNAAAKTKTFTCEGTAFNKRVTLSVTRPSASNTSGFPLGTFIVNSTPDVQLNLLIPKTIGGVVSYQPSGTVAPGSGSIVVSAVDSVNNQMTGTYSFTALINNYDKDKKDSIVSVTVAVVSGGGFNKVPYTFVSK